MKIAIECRSLIKPLTGIGKFTKDMITMLSESYPDLQIYLLVPNDFHPDAKIPNSENIHIIKSPISNWQSAPRIIWYLFKVPFVVRKIQPDYFLSPMSYVPYGLPKYTKRIVVIHDVVHLEFKQTMTYANRIYNWLLFKRSVLKSEFIWCNSNYTKDKISQYFPKRICKDMFVGLSVDPIFKQITVPLDRKDNLSKRLKITDTFILFVGSLEPRKNLEFLLKLTPQLYKTHNIKTIVVGAKGWKNSSIHNVVTDFSFPQDSIHFAGYLTTEELVDLYNMASCYVSTSLNEGFGMPQLEALFCGCPVVTANNSGMREVVSGRGILVDGWDENEWITQIVNSVMYGKVNMRELDLKEYNWADIIKRLIKYLDL